MFYIGRWQLSTIFMFLPLYIIDNYTNITNEYVKLCLIQFCGSLIFYWIDAYIFKELDMQRLLNKKKFGLYLMRWQLSSFFMMIPLFCLRSIGWNNSYYNLVIVQFIGAIVFYRVDKWIFKSIK